MQKETWLVWKGDTLSMDSLAILPGSTCITHRGDTLLSEEYWINPMRALLLLKNVAYGDSVYVKYHALPWHANLTVANKSLGLIQQNTGRNIKPYVVGKGEELSFADDKGLQKNGSISRGVLFGNNQNLSVNSTLNLQLSGRISENVSLLASITDDNIPIQPAGNTQQLQDFDQVFIQLYNERSKVIAGDFQLRRPTGYFLNYFKRAQGLYTSSERGDSIAGKWFRVEASAAVSKGRFARNIIQGIEGNQGPYRLKGADNELFIIILSGTEMVYIDGRLLERGMDKDYVIDYNAAEITFTPRQLITKDRRITVEFQYSERRYARPMLQNSLEWKRKNSALFLNVYSEGDAKNQPLQQDLSDDDRSILAASGDNFLNAYRSGIDSLGFVNNEVRYAMVDTAGFDSVFVFSSDSAYAFYRVNFSYVGIGNGDYVEAGFSANGRIYRWVQPVFNGVTYVRQGSYAPIFLLTAPKKNQMIAAGYRRRLGREQRLLWYTEGALSNQDLNTFSARDASNDVGWAARTVLSWNERKTGNAAKQVAIDSTKRIVFGGRANYEFTHHNFKAIERFREVEFQRNWNLGNSAWSSDQHIAGGYFTVAAKRWGKVSIGADALVMPGDYNGLKAKVNTDILTKSKFKALIDASALQTDGLVTSTFLRHRARLSKDIGSVRLQIVDEHERNIFLSADTVQANSYEFFDWEGSLGTVDTLKRAVRVFYRDRVDRRTRDGLLSGAARAEQYGTQMTLRGANDSRLSLQVNNRRLRVVDPELFTQSPENTLVGRLEYTTKLWKGFVQNTTFYEVGSGLEQQREFVYIEVPAGQGVYVWNDYNADGVKDLNEFEVAAFSYDANYIRTFVQSNNYVKTYSNQFNESLALQPIRLVKGKKAVGKFIGRWSSSTTMRVDRKTMQESDWQRFNPFNSEINDSVLLATNGLLRNIVFFNKANPKFGCDYTWQVNESRNLLSNGFESRAERLDQWGSRWNFLDGFTAYAEFRTGRKEATSDFLAGRNYRIVYALVQPKFTYQPSPALRFGVLGQYAEKDNTMGAEHAVVRKLTGEWVLNALEKGSIRGEMNFYSIAYNGAGLNSLAFEMLEGLQPGYNFTWTLGVQKTVASNVQINVQYNGRKPQDLKTIHAGSVQIRAVF